MFDTHVLEWNLFYLMDSVVYLFLGSLLDHLILLLLIGLFLVFAVSVKAESWEVYVADLVGCVLLTAREGMIAFLLLQLGTIHI